MSYTYEQLSKLTVAELRKIADGVTHEAVQGHSTMHKEKLLPALCRALQIEIHHHTAAGANKAVMKAEIKSWKKKRAEALQQKDYTKLREVRRRIHDIKVKLRRLSV